MRIFWINEFKKGNLGMMARPRGNDWLEDEIIKLKRIEVDTVISLLEPNEIVELEIEKEQEICEKWKLDFINYPIRDRNLPTDGSAYLELILKIDQKLRNDKKVVVHCRMGIGRTSIVAAGVLIRNGTKADNVFDLLTEKRTLTVPDTDEQKQWVLKIKNVLQKN